MTEIRNAFTLLLVLCSFAAAQGSSSPKLDYDAASKYSREHRGVAVVVMKGDKIVFENYAMNGAADLPWVLASGSKSFVGVMCAAAIDDKIISGFDEKVSDTITEWKNDPRRSKITIRQLLTLTSGIDAGENLNAPSYSEAVMKTAKYDPGTRFEYGPVPFQIFGELMTRKLKPKNHTVSSYMKRRIIEPLGVKVSMWRSKDGQPLLPQGLALTAKEWIKFGLFLKDKGKWNGKQLIPAKLMDELTVGTKVNPAYGITFWLNADGTGPAGTEQKSISGDIGKKMSSAANVYMAAGAGNQRLYVIPSEDVVIVRFGIFGGFDDREFLTRLFEIKPS